MTTIETVGDGAETAERRRSAVSLYVAGVTLAALAAFVWVTYREGTPFSAALLTFMMLAALADLKEVKLPLVGHVGMSFVPVLAALVALGLWPAMVVAVVSGATSAGFTRDPQKVVFNLANCVLSTFAAGVVYLALTPAEAGMLESVVPAFVATAVDFFATTLLLAGVVALSTGGGPLAFWRRNYQWALPGYLAGATFALAAAWLYQALGIAGLVLALPPLVLIYYSYDIYVSRARERDSFDAERDSFHVELGRSLALHDELRSAQLKVAAEIERARRIQTDLLPVATPVVEGAGLAQRIEFLGEMGGDYYDYLPLPEGRLGIVCGDVMGKGLAAALIMAMARSLLHNAMGPGRSPREVLEEVNDTLARDLEGQRVPYFLTLVLAVYDPATRELTVAGGGHNPVLVAGADGIRAVPSRGAALGVRPGLQYPQDVVVLQRGDTVALYTDGITEARAPDGGLFGIGRLQRTIQRCQGRPLDEALDTVWADIATYRGTAPAGDDATLLLLRST